MFDRLIDDTNPRDLSARLISFLDVTSLNGDDTDASTSLMTEGIVRTFETHGTCPAAVCVFPVFIGVVRKALGNAPVKVATVAAGFPHGLSPLETRVAEVRACLEEGADEIDVVTRRSLALEGRWRELGDEVALFRGAAGGACLKTILEISELKEPVVIGQAAAVCIGVGADFIKTSTGKASAPATIHQATAIFQALKHLSGRRVGFKAAGGIKTKEQAMGWIDAAQNSLGQDWLAPATFRIGASSLYDALCKDLGE